MGDPSTSNKLRQSMLEMSENMSALLDAVDGYRAQLTERGYSPTAAEQGAMEFHSHLLAQAFMRRPSDAG